ncbi:abscission ut checkpoint regulator isoform X2 [Brachionus plicatilis]|uniref:Abscission ut checkpoint regulator isoform X2 n=1 Tax=Brachionus plicatilis TaxID=10195 RepID=A0A3M7RYB5_BRAPC|nr:abscission ut checkpoint regulator isoform X2 [Brachionus plicatilis]
MSCYRCAEKFRFFKKELGCPNCGFSFCSKCLDFRIKVPNKGDKVLSVCQKCHDSLKGEQNSKAQDYSPPKNFVKMVEENKTKVVHQNPDKDIESRLNKLKSDPKRSVPECGELETRLNQLQGRDETYKKFSNLPSKQVVNTPEDLIAKLTEETKIDQNYEEFEKRELEKLEVRLKNLKNGLNLNNEKPTDQTVSSSSNINTDPYDKLVNNMLEEAEFSLKKDEIDEDEWCCLCNDDATIKCSDCDDDLYCKRCFKHTHSSGEFKNHQKSILNSPQM